MGLACPASRCTRLSTPPHCSLALDAGSTTNKPHRKRGEPRRFREEVVGSLLVSEGLQRAPSVHFVSSAPLSLPFPDTVPIIPIMREQSVGGGSSGVKWLGFSKNSDARAEEQQRLGRGRRGRV